MKYIFNRINENNKSAFIKNSVTIDWDKKESVQAKMRVMIADDFSNNK